MASLIVFADAGWPKQHRDCAWMLCEQGKILDQGMGGPSQWPKSGAGRASRKKTRKSQMAEYCDIILTDGQVACLTAILPKGAAGRRSEVIEGVLEGRLLDPPSDSLFHVMSQAADGTAAIAVVNRSRVDTLVKWVHEQGLSVHSVWGDGMLLPEKKQGRCGVLMENELLLPTRSGGFLAVETQGSLPQFGWMAQIVGELPSPLTVLHAATLNIRFADWGQAAGGIDIRGESLDGGQLALKMPTAGGFLLPKTGKARAGPIAFPVKGLLWLVAVMAALGLVLLTAEWLWLRWQERQLQQAMTARFAQLFPTVPVIDPARQMQQQIDGKQRLQGGLGKNDFLLMLHQLSHAGEAITLIRLDYDSGRLKATITLASKAVEPLLARLRSQGYIAEFQGSQQQGERSQGTLVMAVGG